MPKSIRLVIFLLVLANSAALSAQPVLSHATAAQVQLTTARTMNMVEPAKALAVRVNTPDGPLDLLLTPATRLQAQAAPMVSAIRDGRTRLYKGVVAGQPASWVRLSLIDEAWLGAIQVDGKLWLLDPARQHPLLAARLGLGRQDSLVFTMDDVQGLGLIDHGGVLPPPGALTQLAASADRNLADHHLNGAGTNANQYYLGVSLVLDTEFQSHYAGDAQSTAVAILNIVAGIYSAQANIEVYLHALESLADNGSLYTTDSGDLLTAFRVWLDSSSVPFSGLAHLLSGKNFNDNIVGQAWFGAFVCSRSYGNGVNQVTFSAAASATILAHEMGHNFYLPHDGDNDSCPSSGYIMNAITSLGYPPTQFSTCSLDAIGNYLTTNNPACLAQSPDLLFINSFE